MRAVFMTLLVANLLFLAWAKWIDAPRDTGSQDALAHLPRLQLVGESAAPKPTAGKLPAMTLVPSAAAIIAPTVLPPGVSQSPAAANLLPAVPTSPSSPAVAVAEKVALHVPLSPSHSCTSVGPFNDIAHAARAAGLLSQRGYHLQQRAEEGETIEGYWVFVGDLQSDDDVGKVVERLDKGGFTDAHVMKNFSTNRRISVGMFSTRERAENRAAAVKKMGLTPEVGERKFPGTIYWVDVALASDTQKPPPEYLFADIGHARVAIQPCPAGLRPGEGGLPVSAPVDDEDSGARAMSRTAAASERVRPRH